MNTNFHKSTWYGHCHVQSSRPAFHIVLYKYTTDRLDGHQLTIHSDLDDPSSLRHKDYVRCPGNPSFALYANSTILWMNWNAMSDCIGFYSFLGETIHFIYLLCKPLWVIESLRISYSVLVDSPISSLCLHPFSWYSFSSKLFSLRFCSVVFPNPSLTLLKVLYFIQP